MLGQDLCPALLDEGYEIIKTNSKTMDITNDIIVKRVLNEIRPDMVFHCAAYTNVDKAESETAKARLINYTGTKNIAKACNDIDTTIIYISTDYVFDGNKKSPYLPTDKPNPINHYGLTKFEGEEAVKKYCKKYYIVRTSWLYGINGKNFVETMLSLADNPDLKVVNDQTGCPTSTIELAKGIIKLIKNYDYGTYHICAGGQTSRYGFAKKIFEYSNLKTSLKPCKTNEFVRPAKRPLYSVMDNGGLCRSWQDALKDYLKLRGKL